MESDFGVSTKFTMPRKQATPSSLRLADVYQGPDFEMMGENLKMAAAQLPPGDNSSFQHDPALKPFGGSRVGQNTAAAKAFRYRLPEMDYEGA
jgi:hypothetical protein